MPTVLITGANRGIGLEFARQYAGQGWQVIATTRQVSAELDALGVTIEPLDLSDADAVTALAAKIDGSLNLYIANAGTSEPRQPGSAEDARQWQQMMMVNAIAPFMLGKALLPRMIEGGMTEGGKMIAISSGMGSITENSGGWVPYRTSKAALNMAWSSLAIDARKRGVACVALSPGWVKTRMGGTGAEITAEESVSEMRALIGRLSIADTGKFLRRNGSEIAW